MQDNLTPMMRQYREAKDSIPPDAVLLFRMGDFYEEFFEDAEVVSSTLELTLTKRQGVPMCGFPHHALDTYLPRLVAAGVKVAVAEQMEDPKFAQGIVKRQVTRVITPGTIMEERHIQNKVSRPLKRRRVNPNEASEVIKRYKNTYVTTIFTLLKNQRRIGV